MLRFRFGGGPRLDIRHSSSTEGRLVGLKSTAGGIGPASRASCEDENVGVTGGGGVQPVERSVDGDSAGSTDSLTDSTISVSPVARSWAISSVSSISTFSVGSAASDGCPMSGAPQLLQNLSAGAISLPQLGHVVTENLTPDGARAERHAWLMANAGASPAEV